jgi:hypothetical protein
MLEALKRLLSPEYLVVAEPGPLGGLWVLYVGLGLLFAAGLAAALWVLLGQVRREQSAARRAWAWFELWVCLAGLGTVIGRFLGWPGWSARIWPYSLAALAVSGVLAYRFRRLRLPRWLARQARILALLALPAKAEQDEAAPSSVRRTSAYLLALAVHLLGIALVLAGRYEWPFWLAPVVLLLLLAPQAPLLLRRQRPSLMGLTPLLGAYAVNGLWAAYLALDITVIPWQGLAFPDPLTSLFYVDAMVLAAVAHSLLCQLRMVTTTLGKPRLFWRWAVAGLLVATLAWAGIVYFGKRTHGATASDPYAYAQMGVDLAENGTFLHRFDLFQQVIPLDIAYAPLQPVGYHVPRNALGDCPSVWATGASALLAAGYGLLGETGLYVTTPIVALLALAATWLLVQETLRSKRSSHSRAKPAPAKAWGGNPYAVIATEKLPPSAHEVQVHGMDPRFRGDPIIAKETATDRKPSLRGLWKPRRSIPALTGALAIALLTTSPEHVDRLLVPMADAAAQLFTVLTLLFALRGMRQMEQDRRGLLSFTLAGIAFAWAYWTRHTQLVLALPVLLAVLLGSRARRGEPTGRHIAAIALALLAFAAASLVAALPDIVYRWRVFGGPFATETTELPLMGLQHIGPVAWQMLRDALVSGEWGYLFPLAVYGGYRLVRQRPCQSLVLGSALAAVLLVHLTYHSLRLRDLISLFPLVDLATAYGAVMLVQRAWTFVRKPEASRRLGASFLSVSVVAWVILSLSLSRWAMIDNLWKPGWASFGYMHADNRAAFDRLAQLTEPEAVIGASLNAGAVMMYTGRDAIRPYDSWTEDKWALFLDAMRNRGRPVYLLDDGGLMAEFIEQEQARHRLTPIEELRVPLFYTRDRETGWLYRLEWE